MGRRYLLELASAEDAETLGGQVEAARALNRGESAVEYTNESINEALSGATLVEVPDEDMEMLALIKAAVVASEQPLPDGWAEKLAADICRPDAVAVSSPAYEAVKAWQATVMLPMPHNLHSPSSEARDMRLRLCDATIVPLDALLGLCRRWEARAGDMSEKPMTLAVAAHWVDSCAAELRALVEGGGP